MPLGFDLGRKGSKHTLPRGSRGAAMQRIQWGLGVVATLLVAVVWWTGWFDWLENSSIDFRARTFPSGNAVPSDRIAIIAIDDAAIENIGRWPWNREKLALVIDELTNADAGVIALDLLLDDEQEPRPVVGPDAAVTLVNDDELLGKAIRRHGRVVSAVSFKFTKEERNEEILRADYAQLYLLMQSRPELVGQPWEAVQSQIIAALPRFKDLPYTKGKEIDKLRLRWAAAVALSMRAEDSSIQPPEGEAGAQSWAESAEPSVPVWSIASASRRLANVTFDSYDADGLTRRIPLMVKHNGRLWPTLGLAAAAEFLASTPKNLTVSSNAVILNVDQVHGERRSLAFSVQRVATSRIAGMHIVSWPRGTSGGGIPYTDWQRQFYDTASQRPAEVPIGLVYEPARLALAVRENLVTLRQVISIYQPVGLLDENRLAQWNAADAVLATQPVGSIQWSNAYAVATLVTRAIDDDAKALIELALSGGPIETLSKSEQDTVANLSAARDASTKAHAAITQGVMSIAEIRGKLRQWLGKRVCFVGWTATGSLADFVATSIDPRTPGVHVHAAVCNSLLTGFERTPGPVLGQLAVLLTLGMIGTWIGVRASVVGGPLLVVVVLALWGTFASVGIWSLQDSIWAIAGPGIAAVFGWLVVVLHRLLVEQRARRKTEERFKSYVSPAVVDILVANPSLNSMAPQQRELTVFFSDIAGFTTIAERLGSKGTADVLATYLGTVTQGIQSHGATLDKYIGDAIVAFWGAPVEDPEHARNACIAAVEVMTTLERLNSTDAFGQGVKLLTRIGLATGDLMVGDFGNPPRNSSYTVIGDTANLGSRLEGANKVFGSRTLVSDRTRQLAGPGFLWRAVGTIKVKGKNTGIKVHELLPGLVKGEQTADWIALSEALVADYQAERFDDALSKAVLLREQFHDEVFASAYGEAITAVRAGLTGSDFDGSLTLTDK